MTVQSLVFVMLDWFCILDDYFLWLFLGCKQRIWVLASSRVDQELVPKMNHLSGNNVLQMDKLISFQTWL